MTSSVQAVLKSHLSTTFQDVADEVVRELGLDARDVENERTLRRRVYDVLNVFVAMGLVLKEGKSIRYREGRGSTESSVSSTGLEDKVHSMELDLIGKIRILVGWQLIISRNRRLSRPRVTIPVARTLFVGFKQISDQCYDHTSNGHRVIVHSESPPTIYSPLEVIDKMDFTPEERCAVVNQNPSLKAIIPIMFPDIC
jgi:hypothetical protein